MKKIILLAAFMLLFGCFDGGGQITPGGNETNTTNLTNQTVPPIQIIIGNQTNQTTGKNVTEEPPPTPPPEPEGMTYEYKPDQIFGVYFIDVGGPGLQGDAILVKKGDMDILIDAGAAEKGPMVVDFLRSHGVDDLEVLLSTNGDPGRYGGMDTVADAFMIEEFWWSGNDLGDAAYATVTDRMEAEARKVMVIRDGFSADLNGMNFTVINPSMTQTFDDVNNDAIVLRIVDRNVSLLLTSDIQTGAQGRLINTRTEQIKTNILQAPYYGVGAGTSSIGLFLTKATPDVVIITGSSDESAANGGSREPFKRLMDQYGIKYYENYVNGTVRISSDGQAYSVQNPDIDS